MSSAMQVNPRRDSCAVDHVPSGANIEQHARPWQMPGDKVELPGKRRTF